MRAVGSRPILITGGAGFIGSNLADRLAAQGHDILLYDALSRPGVEANLAWLKARHGSRIQAVIADVRDAPLLREAVRGAAAIFHFAAQVAVTTSLESPRDDFDINVAGTFNLLEAARTCETPPPIIFASTNKVYGDLADLDFARGPTGYSPVDPAIRAHGVGEDRPLEFHTPYGCSKGAADQYVLDYARSFGMPAAVLRMSCIYGQRQLGTEDQGWVAHFLIRAIERRPITLYGDGDQVRDILDVRNAVEAYIAAWRRIDRVAGRAFNLGGGPANAVSLRTLIKYIGELTEEAIPLSFADWRQGDQRYFVADTRAAKTALGLGATVPWRTGVAQLAHWLADQRGLALAEPSGRVVQLRAREAAL
jgi:CDP-paratose 2-epimerase